MFCWVWVFLITPWTGQFVMKNVLSYYRSTDIECRCQTKQQPKVTPTMNKSHDTQFRVHMHSWREAHHSAGKAAGDSVLFPIVTGHPLCRVQGGLLPRAGERSHYCCSQFCRTPTRSRSHLRHKQISASRSVHKNKKSLKRWSALCWCTNGFNH